MLQNQLIFIVFNVFVLENTCVFSKSTLEALAKKKQKDFCGDIFKLSVDCEDECHRRSLIPLCSKEDNRCLCNYPIDQVDDFSVVLVDLNATKKHEIGPTEDDGVHHAVTLFVQTNRKGDENVSQADQIHSPTGTGLKSGDEKKTAVIHTSDVKSITDSKSKLDKADIGTQEADKITKGAVKPEISIPKEGIASLTKSKSKANPSESIEEKSKEDTKKELASDSISNSVIHPHVEIETKNGVFKQDLQKDSKETISHPKLQVKSTDSNFQENLQPVKHLETIIENPSNTEVSTAGKSEDAKKSTGDSEKIENSIQATKEISKQISSQTATPNQLSPKPDLSSATDPILPHIETHKQPPSDQKLLPSSSLGQGQPSPHSETSKQSLSESSAELLSNSPDLISKKSTDEHSQTINKTDEEESIENVDQFENYVAPARAFKSPISETNIMGALISQTFILSAVIIYVVLCGIFMYMRSYRKKKYDRVPLLENFSDCNDL